MSCLGTLCKVLGVTVVTTAPPPLLPPVIVLAALSALEANSFGDDD